MDVFVPFVIALESIRREAAVVGGVGLKMARGSPVRLKVEGISIAIEIVGEEAYNKGCDAGHPRSDTEGHGSTAVIRTRSGCNVQMLGADHICALWNRIERCFSKRKNVRWLANRYDKTAAS